MDEEELLQDGIVEDEDSSDTPSMPNWKNPPKVDDLKADLIAASSDHDSHVMEVNDWLDAKNCEGKYKAKPRKNRSSLNVHLIKKQNEWRIPSLSEPFLSTDDLFTASPVSAEDKQGAEQNALVLNNQFSTKLNKVDFIDTGIRTFVEEGTVIVRTGWDHQEETVTETRIVYEYEPKMDQETAMLHQNIAVMEQETPSVYNQLPEHMKEAHRLTKLSGVFMTPVDTGRTEEVTYTRTKVNQPTLTVCDYNNTIVDPLCEGDIDKAQFVIHSFESSISDMSKSGLYFNLDKINIINNDVRTAPEHGTYENPSFNFNDKARKKFVVYEYWGFWDIDDTGETKPIVAAWVGDILVRLEENPYPDGKLPFEMAKVLPRTKSVYGEPDAALLLDQQQIAGSTMRGIVDLLARSANSQVGSAKDALDVTNKRKFRSGEDYEYNPGSDPTKAFYMHKFPEIPNSALQLLDIQNRESESFTGVKAFSSGLSGQALGDTATGIRGALDAASKRELSIMRRFANMMIRIGHKIIAMNQAFLSEEEVVRVTDNKFVNVRRDDLAGNFDLRLTISTAEADNHKAEKLAFMLQTNGNNMDPNLSKIIWADIAKLHNMPSLAKQIENYEPQPDPVQQQIAQLQLEKLQWEIQELKSKTQENFAQAEYDLARAREAGSKADLNDLNYVEQESGVTQEREKELAGEQARGNIALKAFEGGIKLQEKQLDNQTQSVPTQPSNNIS